MWPNRQETADFVTFTEEIPNEELHFFCRVSLDLMEESSLHDVALTTNN